MAVGGRAHGPPACFYSGVCVWLVRASARSCGQLSRRRRLWRRLTSLPTSIHPSVSDVVFSPPFRRSLSAAHKRLVLGRIGCCLPQSENAECPAHVVSGQAVGWEAGAGGLHTGPLHTISSDADTEPLPAACLRCDVTLSEKQTHFPQLSFNASGLFMSSAGCPGNQSSKVMSLKYNLIFFIHLLQHLGMGCNMTNPTFIMEGKGR